MKPITFGFLLYATAAAFAADTSDAKREGALAKPDAAASSYQAGKYYDEGLRLLRSMSEALPLRRTTLKEIAPKYAVEKHEGITWEEAVAEAEARFAEDQVKRAAFLRKYLTAESPEARLKELKCEESGMGMGTPGSHSVGFVLGDWNAREAEIRFWVAEHRLSGNASLDVAKKEINGVAYLWLSFDVSDHLTSASRELHAEKDGTRISILENTSVEGGINFYHVSIRSPHGEDEMVSFTPELVIKERWVHLFKDISFHEIYEDGRLRMRKHNRNRHVNGGTENYIERVETFP